MISTRTRTIIVSLVTAVGIGATALAPSAAQATTKQADLKEKGYTCEHTAENFTVCTDKEGHEWYCEESTDECGQVKLQVVKGVKFKVPVVKFNAPPVAAKPVVRVTSSLVKAKPVA